MSICEKYADSHSIKFNVNKSQVVIFPCKKEKVAQEFYLCSEKIPNVDEVKHLGHKLSTKVDGGIDLSYISGNFVKSFNVMYALFGDLPQ